jgi:translation elongation factor EF-Ts
MTDNRMGLKVGDSVIHCDRMFTITNMRCDECAEGIVLHIRACDPDMANREQQSALNVEQTKEQLMETLRKLMGEGGHGGMGFGIGL